MERPLIPTIPTRPTRPIAQVFPKISDLIDRELKEWDVRLLKNYVVHEDIPLIRSLVISPTNRHDLFCWNFTKNGKYTIKYGYWVARNLLENYEDNEVMASSIPSLCLEKCILEVMSSYLTN